MPRIFISYRRAAENFAAQLLDEHLCQRFGSDQIFRASRSVRLGDDFPPTIWDSLRGCSALLAVIDNGWPGSRADGERRIDDPADYVRREIAEALRLGIRVIPVLVGDVAEPAATELPEALKELATRQYLRLYARHSRYDLQRLLDELADMLGEHTEMPGGQPRPAEPQPSAQAASFAEGGVFFGAPTHISGGSVVGRDNYGDGHRPGGARR